jgi:hypothetical protein
MPALKLPAFRPLDNLPSNLSQTNYFLTARRPGDIVFSLPKGLDNVVGHSSLLAPDVTKIVHSVGHLGVIVSSLQSTVMQLIFRYTGPEAIDISLRAANLAREWAADVPLDAMSHHNPGKVGYSAFHVPVVGYGTRAIGAGFGTSKFGKGAQARLLKYETRRNAGKVGPSNLICSEMCALAYQMACANEKTTAFIKLDPKHTTPRHLVPVFAGCPRLATPGCLRTVASILR